MATTPKYALRTPVNADPATVPADMLELATDVETNMSGYGQGLFSARPAFGKAGRWYYATDNGLVYWDTGAAWVTINPAVASGAAAGVPSLRALGTGALEAAAGNDSRLSDARTPTDASVNAAKVSATLKPSGTAVAATEALRALGTTAATAAAGNDSRLSDSRAPTGVAGGDLSGTYPNPSFAAGSILNVDVNAAAAIALSKLAAVPAGRAIGDGTQTMATSASLTVASCNLTLSVLSGGMLHLLSQVLQVPVAGWFSVSGRVTFGPSATGSRRVELIHQPAAGGTIVLEDIEQAPSNGTRAHSVQVYWEGTLTANDKFTIAAAQNSGSTLAIVGALAVAFRGNA